MKLNIRRSYTKLLVLMSSVFLSACCGLCTKCPADAECTIIPSNAATGIKSSAGVLGPPGDIESMSARRTPLPEGWRATYPLFEGDFFSVSLPPGVTDSPATVVEKIVRHMGFADPTGRDVLEPEFFHVGPHELDIGGGDILEVAQINCENRSKRESRPEFRLRATEGSSIEQQQAALAEESTVTAGQQVADAELMREQRAQGAILPAADPATSGRPASFCDMKERQQRELIQRATGMSPDAYLDRRLSRHFFFQRPQHNKWPTNPESSEELCVPDPNASGGCIDVFIEHSAITASVRRDGTVASVSGRIFPTYKVTNEPVLHPAEALELAHGHLWKIPGISEYRDWPVPERKPPLILLPYADTARFDLSRLGSFRWPTYPTPQLRYAYRTTLWGNYVDEAGRRVEAASWRAWVDAETGDILQLLPQFAFADPEMADGEGWHIDPSAPIPTPPTSTKFRVDDVANDYCLKLNGVFEQLEYSGTSANLLPTLCSVDTDFASGLTCSDPPWDCVCHQGTKVPIAYLHMNAYSNVDKYQRVLDAALCNPSTSLVACDDGHFRAARNENDYVPMRIEINNFVSRGRHVATGDEHHLVLGEVGAAYSSTNCSTPYSIDVAGLRPGAQDATVIIHEFSHMVTDGILSSRPDDWCGEAGCPVPHSLDLVHDLADGFAAMHTHTNWFGAWYANVEPNDDNKSETHGIPRELNYLDRIDHFPEHRKWSELPDPPDPVEFGHKEYADGQIAGAAVWAVTESMERWMPTLGPADFQSTLLNVLPSFRYFPDACRAYKQGDTCDYPDDCDIDVYRLLHFLLTGLLEIQSTTGVTVSANKILAGFAKTGIFLVPPSCIGADTGAVSAGVESYCPNEEYGGDAVIEIKDDWLDHNFTASPPQVEVPGFEIWTGPEFRFAGDDAEVAQAPDEPPCNKHYKVALANNGDFEHDGNQKLMKETEYLEADNDCHAEWSPPSEWNQFLCDVADLSQTKGLSNLYYRVVTSPKNDETARSSSEYPGKPNYDPDIDQRVDPPFAMLNDTGEPIPQDIVVTCN